MNNNNFKYNDCIGRGACSISPEISALQEVMVTILKQIAYYLIKFIELDIEQNDITESLIYQVSRLDAAKDFTKEQLLNEFSKQYTNLIKLHKEYKNVCKERKIECKDLKNLIKFFPETNLTEILKKGEKTFQQKYKSTNASLMDLSEILFSVIKSVCINLVRIFEFDCNSQATINSVLTSLNLLNSTKITTGKLKKHIEQLAINDIELLKQINNIQIQLYGQITETEVSYSTRPHKAILVSGSNLCDLDALMKQTQGKDIDVYTNGNLLSAHLFPHFREYKNLIGHFGNGINSTILDFATFPGAILLTKNEVQNIDYLYRGRLFASDEIPVKGIVNLKNDDFTPLIESALNAKGFNKGQKRHSEVIGYNEDKLNSVLENIVNNKFRHVFLIGLSNFSPSINDYFEKFFSIMPDDTFAISFSYNPFKDNVYSINLGNDYSLLYGVLHKIFTQISLDSNKLTMFLTKCDINSLSSIINLKSRGAKNIYLSECPPLMINPAVLRTFAKLYDIHEITTPKEDLKKLVTSD